MSQYPLLKKKSICREKERERGGGQREAEREEEREKDRDEGRVERERDNSELYYTRIHILGSCLFLQSVPANLYASRSQIKQ